jgi:hypothetical protein
VTRSRAAPAETSTGRLLTPNSTEPAPNITQPKEIEMATSTPTVVLVHGAFADASSYARVIEELLAEDVEVRAPA